MNIDQIAEAVSAKVIYEADVCRDRDIASAVAADLMSEVMLGTVDGSIIVTGLINPQVIRTAEMMNASAVLFVRGKKINDQIIDLARDRGVTVLSSGCTMYEACGRLYSGGIKSGRG